MTDFIKIMGEHQSKTPHYRADHTGTMKELFGASFEANTDRATQWIAERKR